MSPLTRDIELFNTDYKIIQWWDRSGQTVNIFFLHPFPISSCHVSSLKLHSKSNTFEFPLPPQYFGCWFLKYTPWKNEIESGWRNVFIVYPVPSPLFLCDGFCINRPTESIDVGTTLLYLETRSRKGFKKSVNSDSPVDSSDCGRVLTHGVLAHAGHVGCPMTHTEGLRHAGVRAGAHL